MDTATNVEALATRLANEHTLVVDDCVLHCNVVCDCVVGTDGSGTDFVAAYSSGIVGCREAVVAALRCSAQTQQPQAA